MDDAASAGIQKTSKGGVAGGHAATDSVQFLVGPSTGDEFNASRLRLMPIACWRVDDIRFAFGSSFVKPGIAAEIRHLRTLVEGHPGCPLSLFGHADPVGSDDHNKTLSGRRATAIYAMLIRDTGKWETLFNSGSGGDQWGPHAIQTMQETTDMPAGTPHSALFKAYMDALCDPDFVMTKADFLGQGADSGGKGDYQGCSEFNPVLLFSGNESAQFEQAEDKSPRNAANAPNRRVMALLFRKGSRIDPSKWPCPRATEGTADCIKRFWSDGQTRRSRRLPDERRLFSKTRDTFACRFYQRLTTGSPCHDPLPAIGCHFSHLLRSNSACVPLAKRKYKIQVDGRTLQGATTEEGLIEHSEIPPGEYELEIDGHKTIIAAVPKFRSRIVHQVEGYILFPDNSTEGG